MNMNTSNEVRVSEENLYAGNKRIGYVSGNENCESNGTYTIEGDGVYRNDQKVGYSCGNGEFRIKDGTLWKLSR